MAPTQHNLQCARNRCEEALSARYRVTGGQVTGQDFAQGWFAERTFRHRLRAVCAKPATRWRINIVRPALRQGIAVKDLSAL